MQLCVKITPTVTLFRALVAVTVVLSSCVYLLDSRGAMSGGTIYRNSVWFVKGLREFTRGGYERAAREFNPEDMKCDITGRVFMVTGANSGLGKETALKLAQKGGTVHMICRNQVRGEEAKQDIITKTKNENIHLHLLDVSKPRDVAVFAKQFVESNQQLDVLVNNAGAMINQRETQEDGLERSFATNSLGTYILTTELVPALEKSSYPQVVTVSSGGMLVTKLDPHDLQLENIRNYDGTFAYAQNKRQQVVMSRLWAAKYEKIHFSSMHPGWADTPGVETAMPSFHSKFSSRLRSTEQGADTVVWLCVADRVRSMTSGLFFQDRQSVPEHLALASSRSTDEEEQLLITRLEEIKTRFLTKAE